MERFFQDGDYVYKETKEKAALFREGRQLTNVGFRQDEIPFPGVKQPTSGTEMTQNSQATVTIVDPADSN